MESFDPWYCSVGSCSRYASLEHLLENLEEEEEELSELAALVRS
jgi:hypothetical protein